MTKFLANANNASLQTSDQTGGGKIQQLQAKVTVVPDKFDIDSASTVNNLILSGQSGYAPVIGDKLYLDVNGTVSVQTINTLSNQNAIDASWGLLTIKECPETDELFILGSSNGQLAVSKDGGTSWKYAGQALGPSSVPLRGTNNSLRSVTKFAGKYFLGFGSYSVASTGTYGLAVSSDLMNWSIANSQSFVGIGSSVAVQNGSIMIVVYAGIGGSGTNTAKIYSTIDGTTFTLINTSNLGGFTFTYSSRFNNGYFTLAIAGGMAWSSDGITFLFYSQPINWFITDLYRTSWGGWVFISASGGGTGSVMKSSTINPLTAYTTSLTGIESGNGIARLCVGSSNKLMIGYFNQSTARQWFSKSSDDGQTWTAWANTGVNHTLNIGACPAYSAISNKWFIPANTTLSLAESSNTGSTWVTTSISGAGVQYSVTTSGMLLAAVPAFVAKAGHTISTSAHNIANIPSLVVASSYSYTRNVDDIIITTNNQTGLTANFAQIKVANINNTEEVSKIEFIMQVYSAGQFNQGSGTYGSGSMVLADGEVGEFIPTSARGWFTSKGA